MPVRVIPVTQLIGTVTVGLALSAALAIIAAPAAADPPPPTPAAPPPSVQIVGTRDCVGDANYTMTWTVETDSVDPLDVTVTDADPTGPRAVSPSAGQVVAGTELVLSHTVNPHANAMVSVTVEVAPAGGGAGWTVTSAQLGSNCTLGPAVQVRGVAFCEENGQATVQWELTNSGPTAAEVALDLDTVEPAGSTGTESLPLTIPAGDNAFVDQVLPAASPPGVARAHFTASNPDLDGATAMAVPGVVSYDCGELPASSGDTVQAQADTPDGGSLATDGLLDGAQLADTGAPTLTYAGVGALLLLGGAALIIGARRRGRRAED